MANSISFITYEDDGGGFVLYTIQQSATTKKKKFEVCVLTSICGSASNIEYKVHNRLTSNHQCIIVRNDRMINE